MANIDNIMKPEIAIFDIASKGVGFLAQSEIQNSDGADVLHSAVPDEGVLRYRHYG